MTVWNSRGLLPAPVGSVLQACTAEHDWSRLPHGLVTRPVGLDTRLLADAAAWHRVTGCVAATLRHADWVDQEVMATLERQRSEAVVRHLVSVTELGAIEECFADANIPWVTFKGPVLAGFLYPRPDLRTSVDIDILVPPRRAGSALAALEAAGYVCTEQNWCRLHDEGAGELPLLAPSGLPVDLHWRLVSDAPTRRRFSLPSTALVERRRWVPVGGRQVPTFDPADTLVHLALHAALGGGTRLVWLKDLERSVVIDRPDWETVVVRAHQWRAGSAVALMLARTRRFLGLDLPDGLLEQLSPSRLWPIIESAAVRLTPVPRVAREASLARLVARSARGSGRESGRALLHKARLGVLYRAVPSTAPRRTDSADARDHQRARQALLESAAAEEA